MCMYLISFFTGYQSKFNMVRTDLSRAHQWIKAQWWSLAVAIFRLYQLWRVNSQIFQSFFIIPPPQIKYVVIICFHESWNPEFCYCLWKNWRIGRKMLVMLASFNLFWFLKEKTNIYLAHTKTNNKFHGEKIRFRLVRIRENMWRTRYRSRRKCSTKFNDSLFNHVASWNFRRATN